MTESIQVLIAQNLGVDESRVTEGARLREDLGMDEISSVELAMALDEWSYVKKTDTDFRESADTANSTKDFLRFLP